MADKRKGTAITVGVVVIAAMAIFFVVQALSPTSYTSASEVMARMEAAGFEIGIPVRPPPPVEAPGTKYVSIRGNGYEGTGWIAVSDGSLDALKREFGGTAASVVEGANWIVAVVADTIEAERTEALAREVANALGGEVVSP